MGFGDSIKKIWAYLKEDSWHSWTVSIVLIILIIKFAFFPLLSIITGSQLPLVIIESCSMYHGYVKDYDSSVSQGNLNIDWTGKYKICGKKTEAKESLDFNKYWALCGSWYEERSISKNEFSQFPFKNGLTKGDIIFVWGHSTYENGDVLIFTPNRESISTTPIIHRIVDSNAIATKGDNNEAQLDGLNDYKLNEILINKERIIGKAVGRIPYLGWIKLIFFEPLRSKQSRGLC